MNIEALTLMKQTEYLQHEILGSKIYRVFMPNAHSVLFMLKREQDTVALLADLNGGSPVLYIPRKLPENPEVPPAFCMLLRKHLEEGRITGIVQDRLERVLTLEIDMLGASSRIITKKLIVELAGKNANVLLVQDNVILDCLRHVGLSQNSYRQLLPGREYLPPPRQQGRDILAEEPLELVRSANAGQEQTFLKSFMKGTLGIGKNTAQELLSAAELPLNTEHLDCQQEQDLAEQILGLRQRFENESYIYAVIGRTNQVKSLLLLPPRQLETGARVQQFADFNAAVNYAMSLKPLQLPQHEMLERVVNGECQRLHKKLQALDGDLAAAENAEEQRIIADSLMASIYLLHKGQSSAGIMNIYDGQPLQVQLSPQLAPVDNAQAYYKRYNKYKRAQVEVRMQQENTRELLAYLESIGASLLTATTKAETEEIRQELLSLGLLKEEGKKKNSFKLPKSTPLQIKLPSGAQLYIGKNNKQNDYVTFTLASPQDLWFHTKDIPGSHVVLKVGREGVSEEDIELAVQLAAYCSKAGHGSNVPVDCVQRKYVKKPSGAKPGFVIFTHNKTYYTTPDQEALEQYFR